MKESDKGIARLNIIPMRNENRHRAELVSQLLFGEHYEVLEADAQLNWLKVKNVFDGYTGWIDAKQHHPISSDHFQEICNSEYLITTQACSDLRYGSRSIPVVMGTLLPFHTTELFQATEDLVYRGESKPSGEKRDFAFVHQMAQGLLGAPYLWGGRSVFGIDCSGFTQLIFKLAGYQLHRDSTQQAKQGRAVAHLTDSQPGDLLFFDGGKGSVDHVGIFIEEGKVMHASGEVRYDLFDAHGIKKPSLNEYTRTLLSIRRIINDER